jgi:hypothetical protein
MTWIIGCNSFFGYTFLISDIQITVEHSIGRKIYFDCCQKIYPISNSLAAGFAGNVEMGFKIIERLIELSNNVLSVDHAWALDEICNDWLPNFMSEIYKDNPKDHKGGCQIIMASAHPTKNRGVNSGAVTQIATFTAPDFKPMLKEGHSILSIGSGSNRYENELSSLCMDTNILQAAIGGSGAYGAILERSIRGIFDQNPKDGISPFYQLLIIERGNIHLHNPLYYQLTDKGPMKIHEVPSVCTSFNDLKQYLNSKLSISGEYLQSVTC